MKVLITGAGGFLGRGLVVPFEERGDSLRLMDVVSFSSRHETVIGDVADLETVMKAAAGMEAIVIAHMAPRTNNSYDFPTLPFDINVKGTANLFHAAVKNGIKKVVVISSTSVMDYCKSENLPHDLPPMSRGFYGLSKVCQEMIAESFALEHKIRVACLRVGYIVDGDKNVDKYGRKIEERAPLDTDRRDIGEVARLFLDREDLTFERFTVMSTPEAMIPWDLRYTCERLNWKPKYDFSWLRIPPNK